MMRMMSDFSILLVNDDDEEDDMTKGDLLADLSSHGRMSQTIVKLHGWNVHSRMLGILMGTSWKLDDDVHYYFRPDHRAPDGLWIDFELANG